VDSLKELGKRIRILRRLSDITQAELAERCGLSVNFIALLERGRSAPSFETIERLAVALRVPMAELFEFRNEVSRSGEKERVIRKLTRIRSGRDLRLIEVLADFLARR